VLYDPYSGSISLRVESPDLLSGSTLRIRDVLGCIVEQRSLGGLNIDSTIKLKQLIPGWYSVELETPYGLYRDKFVVTN
jgi:hypothetical protein